MRFSASSFVIGAATATAVIAARDRLRPVVVELAALGVHFAHVARSIALRQREHGEDLIAEIKERVRARERRPAAARPPASATAN
jgi:hypothetical protein